MRDKDKQRDREIGDVIRQEMARRGRPVDPDALRERRELFEDYLWILRNGTEEQFRSVLTSLGWQPGSPEFDRFLQLWRALPRS